MTLVDDQPRAGSSERAGERPAIGRRHPLPWWPFAAIVGAGAILRLIGIGRLPLDFDESFTATAGRLPVGRLFSFLAHHDSHPPFDYLVRIPFARAGASAGLVRLPSAIAAIAALAVLAWWARGWGRLGLLTCGLAAIAAFQITYAQDARMYATMMLAGALVAALAWSWSRGPQRWQLPVLSAALLAGCFDHVSALPLAAGAFLIPGLRRDRPAWAWRAAVVAPVTLWAVLWGLMFRQQLGRNSGSWIPLTTPHGFAVTINELVDGFPALAWLVLPAVIVGLVIVARRDRPLFRALLCTGVVPVLFVTVAGFHWRVLLPRTIAFAWPVPLIALAALIDAAWDRWAAYGLAALALAGAVMVPSTVQQYTSSQQGLEWAIGRVEAVARPGDAVAVDPAFLAPSITWRFADTRARGASPVPPARSLAADDLAVSGPTLGLGTDTRALVVGRAPWTGRVWLIQSDGYADPAPGVRPCGAVQRDDGFRYQCLMR